MGNRISVDPYRLTPEQTSSVSNAKQPADAGVKKTRLKLPSPLSNLRKKIDSFLARRNLNAKDLLCRFDRKERQEQTRQNEVRFRQNKPGSGDGQLILLIEQLKVSIDVSDGKDSFLHNFSAIADIFGESKVKDELFENDIYFYLQYNINDSEIPFDKIAELAYSTYSTEEDQREFLKGLLNFLEFKTRL